MMDLPLGEVQERADGDGWFLVRLNRVVLIFWKR